MAITKSVQRNRRTLAIPVAKGSKSRTAGVVKLAEYKNISSTP
jgi:hypothetical protein